MHDKNKRKKVKNMAFCINCGALIPETANFVRNAALINRYYKKTKAPTEEQSGLLPRMSRGKTANDETEKGKVKLEE